jgi:hypothetical protein
VQQKNKQQTKTTKHTIEFSNNTPGISWPAAQPTRGESRVLVVRTVRTLRDPEIFLEVPPRSAENRVATTSLSYVRGTPESNPLRCRKL